MVTHQNQFPLSSLLSGSSAVITLWFLIIYPVSIFCVVCVYSKRFSAWVTATCWQLHEALTRSLSTRENEIFCGHGEELHRQDVHLPVLHLLLLPLLCRLLPRQVGNWSSMRGAEGGWWLKTSSLYLQLTFSSSQALWANFVLITVMTLWWRH